MNGLNYVCSKCHNTQCDIGEIRAAGGFWSKIFDVQGKKFTTVICTRCRHVEFYQADTSMLGNIFDFFTD